MKTPTEIERQFLLNTTLTDVLQHHADLTSRRVESVLIEQVYMPHSGDWTIRARSVTGEWPRSRKDYWLTLKHRLTAMTCTEIEKELHAQEYLHMREKALHKPLVKRRHYMHGSLFVIDEFINPEFARLAINGDNNLVVAEIELDAEDQEFERPGWLGLETDHGWSNRMLAQALMPH